MRSLTTFMINTEWKSRSCYGAELGGARTHPGSAGHGLGAACTAAGAGAVLSPADVLSRGQQAWPKIPEDGTWESRF